MTPTILIAICAYIAIAIGLLVSLIQQFHRDRLHGPLSPLGMILVALAWPAVFYELLTAGGSQDDI